MIDLNRDPEAWRLEVVELMRALDRPAAAVALFERVTEP